jgi:heme exporter protein A
VRLVVEGLELWRGDRPVIEDLSFSVEGGEALVLAGPNGSGKTTLLLALAGHLAPEAGTVAIEGAGDGEPAEHMHLIGHRDAVKQQLTVAENLGFWSRFLAGGQGGPPQIETALATVGLEALADVPAGYLSQGQRRRVALARLLVAPRPVWLLDEPTVSLDAASQRSLTAMIETHAGTGGITIAATHMPLGLARSRELRLGGPP